MSSAGARRARRALAPLLGLALLACGSRARDVEAVKAVIARYDELLRDGYQRQNMSWMREVATEEQAQKLYHHMAALAEGNLRLVSTLEDLRFVRVDVGSGGQASAETREVWDFTHYRIATGEKFAEEVGFVYRMAYTLRKEQGRWIITGVDVLSGEPGRTTIPWPNVDRFGNVQRGGPAAGGTAPR